MSGAAPAPPPDTDAEFPVLADAGGYLLQPRDAAFVGVSLDSLRAVAARVYPLGFPSSEEWQACLAELRAACKVTGDMLRLRRGYTARICAQRAPLQRTRPNVCSPWAG